MSDTHAIPCMHGMPTESIRSGNRRETDDNSLHTSLFHHFLEISNSWFCTLSCKQRSTIDNYLFSCKNAVCKYVIRFHESGQIFISDVWHA